MSTEVIAIVVSAFGLMVTLGGGIFAGFAWDVRQMGGLRTELRSDIAELRTGLRGDIAELRTELRGDIAELRTELKGDIAELRTELRGGIAELSADMTATKVTVARLDGLVEGRQRLILAR